MAYDRPLHRNKVLASILALDLIAFELIPLEEVVRSISSTKFLFQIAFKFIWFFSFVGSCVFDSYRSEWSGSIWLTTFVIFVLLVFCYFQSVPRSISDKVHLKYFNFRSQLNWYDFSKMASAFLWHQWEISCYLAHNNHYYLTYWVLTTFNVFLVVFSTKFR